MKRQRCTYEWGKRGKGKDEFDIASGVAVGRYGIVYVSDTSNHRVQAFFSDGQFAFVIGNEGQHGLFKAPTHLCLSIERGMTSFRIHQWLSPLFNVWPPGLSTICADYAEEEEILYVVDALNQAIHGVYTSSKMCVRTCSCDAYGNFAPVACAADDDGCLYVLEAHTIHKFDHESVWLWGGNTRFRMATSLACDVSRRQLYVVDWELNQLFSLDVEQGDIQYCVSLPQESMAGSWPNTLVSIASSTDHLYIHHHDQLMMFSLPCISTESPCRQWNVRGDFGVDALSALVISHDSSRLYIINGSLRILSIPL